jgi:hypothetical protein
MVELNRPAVMRTQSGLALSQCLHGHAKGPSGSVWSGSCAACGADIRFQSHGSPLIQCGSLVRGNRVFLRPF